MHLVAELRFKTKKTDYFVDQEIISNFASGNTALLLHLVHGRFWLPTASYFCGKKEALRLSRDTGNLRNSIGSYKRLVVAVHAIA